MLPDKCSIKEQGRQCVNPPEFVVSITVNSDEYMFGVTCTKHKQVVSEKIKIMQKHGTVPLGKIGFSPLKTVGTDCIHGDQEDFIEIDGKNFKI